MGNSVAEFGNSLNDRIEFIRSQFDRSGMSSSEDDNGNFQFFYVTDVFDDHVVVRGNSKYYKVKFREKGDTIKFDEKSKWISVQLNYVKEMSTGSFRDLMVISELKGKYPEVKIFDDVDVKELTQGEKDPVFVTIPIGMANITSGNRRFYSDKFVQEMEKQVRDKKPIGLMGHLSESQRATDFPDEAVHWIGTKRINEILWGKGYIPAGEPRNRLQRYKATQKKMGTSIDASADGIWDPKLGAYNMVAETLDLAQIDFAPADRAGIPSLAAVPLLTKEMLDSAVGSFGTNDIIVVREMKRDMERDEAIQSLTVADIPSIPAPVLQAIQKTSEARIRELLGLSADADISSSITEMRLAKHNYEQGLIRAHIQELASSEDNGIKVEAVRDLAVNLVMSRIPSSNEQAESFYKEVAASKNIQETLSKFVQTTMGPPVGTPQIPNGTPSEKKQGKYFITPEVAE